jgi:hypothetical protein
MCAYVGVFCENYIYCQVIEALPIIDHSAITYEPFHKDFYTPVPEVASMYNSEVMLLREELEVSHI